MLLPASIEADNYLLTRVGEIAGSTLANPYDLAALISNIRRLQALPNVSEADAAIALTAGVPSLALRTSIPRRLLAEVPAAVRASAPSTQVATVTAYLRMTADRMDPHLESVSYRLGRHIVRYAGILGRVYRETRQFENLDAGLLVRMCRALARSTDLEDAMNDMPDVKISTHLTLFNLGILSKHEAQRHKTLVQERLGQNIASQILQSHYRDLE